MKKPTILTVGATVVMFGLVGCSDEEDLESVESKESSEVVHTSGPQLDADVETFIEGEQEESVEAEDENNPYDQSYSYNQGQEVAELHVPTISSSYPVYWGTDEATLDQGVGYHVSDFTTPPDGERHTVVSGHRDTVFSELGALEEGHALSVDFEGKTYHYTIEDIWITDKDDRTVIVRHDEPTLTLTTCYPFDYIGAAPDRYIVQASLDYVEEH
ncbi:sortase A [Salsuginibacillus halophilus]|uniref:Sortase A n=1 Tax=Salsuginibacillus halophilus TaxID=517424 RepID=A0A2P8HLG9_9BACI|nr:class D sortase [Salsuginibacillus halophilus]PSL47068.1 sortase A [Salsuginibacillus halophilus]